jgi:hypothetical protein
MQRIRRSLMSNLNLPMDEEATLNLRRSLLAQCFQHLAYRLGEALGEAQWSS